MSPEEWPSVWGSGGQGLKSPRPDQENQGVTAIVATPFIFAFVGQFVVFDG